MDAITYKYSKSRYEEIVKEVSSYLKKVRYNPNKIPFIPVFEFEDDNMIKRSTNLDWYNGLTFLEVIDQINESKIPSEKPLHLSLPNMYKIDDIGLELHQSNRLKMKLSGSKNPKYLALSRINFPSFIHL
ncbi:hypothetical protein L1887_01809 [Cichorium endivia]|nr:hypothetical protein L1887_01809 [Cichorium endivia]